MLILDGTYSDTAGLFGFTLGANISDISLSYSAMLLTNSSMQYAGSLIGVCDYMEESQTRIQNAYIDSDIVYNYNGQPFIPCSQFTIPSISS